MKDFYRKQIINMIDKIHSEALLRRIYNLAEYLYVYEDDKGETEQRLE
jgi:hypothetical protein